MSNCKPFKTIDEQIDILKSRGIFFGDKKLEIIKGSKPTLHQKILDGMHASEDDIRAYVIEHSNEQD